MTTWTIQFAAPAVPAAPTSGDATESRSDEASYVDSGLRLDDTVQGQTGVSKSYLDYLMVDQGAATTAIALSYLLRELQRVDKRGLSYRAFDGVSTYVYPWSTVT